MAAPFQTLLLTGAAGTLGRVLTPALQPLAQCLKVSDLPGPLAATTLPAGVDACPCDLADTAGVLALLHGVQAVVHMGGVSYEGPWQPILQSNIHGVHNLYEAARRNGTRRIVFASSNHVTGCYAQTDHNSPTDPPRPDGNYGLSKLFGEGIASLYFDRYGIETVCLRIGTATPTPPDRRGLSTWLSLPDLVRLVTAALTRPGVGFLVTYGMSANTRGWWDTQASWDRLGYAPQDNAEAHAAAVEHRVQPEGSPAARCQGGIFLGLGPYDDPPLEP
jgi:uronate dehydrogenase